MTVDLQILLFIQEHFTNPVFNVIMPFVSFIAENGVLWLAVAVLMLFFKKSRRFGVMVIIAVAAGFLIGELGMKNIVCRIRPCNEYPALHQMIVEAPTSFSFPSGHSCSSFAAATIIFFYDKRFGVPALILAATIAFSRMYLFVHYPTDVLCGICLGIVMAVLTYTVYKQLVKCGKLSKGDNSI